MADVSPVMLSKISYQVTIPNTDKPKTIETDTDDDYESVTI